MSETDYDVGIVGGGVVGCAVLFELSRQGFRCVLLEKSLDIMTGASAGNSGMLVTGFDAPLFSLEQHCIKSTQEVIFELIKKCNIPHRKCGAIVIAWTDEENRKIPLIKENAHKAGIDSVYYLNQSDLRKREPHLKQTMKGALSIPGECVVDSSLLGIIYAQQAVRLGAKICTNCEVTGFKDGILTTSRGLFKVQATVNCAGLYGDKVDSLVGINSFSIQPRKGQYCVFGKSASNFLDSIIFPVPSDKSKGIALFKSVYNNLIIGPTAEDVARGSQPTCNPKIHSSLKMQAGSLIPELDSHPPVGQYLGLRPATQFKDYQIRTHPQINWVTVGGIRSTGVSGSLGIGQYVSERLVTDLCLEPTRGTTCQISEMDWCLGSDKSSVSIDGCHYKIAHPLFLYGNQNSNSKL
ncbi:glycerol 3-phosphate dehydrogenase-like [Physella acuta]|uniref:glycerol 3-phosphate dehydrogenase-like n=1 Tax=Physella acuta TaxID=109671 RepID=UPI0027DC1013|nr:glycerol 3-phosphate dehydrogenase-like [Physella acuta]